mmetsp:Transcript_29683/g.64147  ORF Transcript_29683/g.64147 Transcript_29683/m.64147 type:complete len:89 (+) Transcript_29683:166-432(+)
MDFGESLQREKGIERMDSEETSKDWKTSPKPFLLSNSQVQLSPAPFESSTFEWPQPAEKSDPRPLESQKFRLASRHGTLSVFVSALFT